MINETPYKWNPVVIKSVEDWRYCPKGGICTLPINELDAQCPCAKQCATECEWCPCESCGCPVREHFIPDANFLVERGIDPNNCGGTGKINTCGMCGECYQL